MNTREAESRLSGLRERAALEGRSPDAWKTAFELLETDFIELARELEHRPEVRPVKPVAPKLVEYTVRPDCSARLTSFDLGEVNIKILDLIASGEKFEFETETHDFERVWEWAVDNLKNGNNLLLSQLSALKIGMRAGRTINRDSE